MESYYGAPNRIYMKKEIVQEMVMVYEDYERIQEQLYASHQLIHMLIAKKAKEIEKKYGLLQIANDKKEEIKVEVVDKKPILQFFNFQMWISQVDENSIEFALTQKNSNKRKNIILEQLKNIKENTPANDILQLATELKTIQDHVPCRIFGTLEKGKILQVASLHLLFC